MPNAISSSRPWPGANVATGAAVTYGSTILVGPIYASTGVTNVTASTTAVTYAISTATTTGGALLIDDAWTNWNNLRMALIHQGTTTGGTWNVWCDDAHHQQIRQNTLAWANWHQQRAEAEEQIRQVLADDRRLREATPEEARTAIERHRQEQARRVAELDAANRRAEDLLRRELTEEQIRDLDKKGCFYLETVQPDGARRRYRIDRGSHGNVKRLDAKGSIIESLCIQPRGVPDADAMLAQKLWLETDEPTFRKIANIRVAGA